MVLVPFGSVIAGWGVPRQLTDTPENSNFPERGNGLAVHEQYVHIVYADKEGTLRKVFYLRSTDRGANWQTAVVIGEASEAYTFSVCADNSGNVHFINQRSGGILYYRRSTDNGATWQNAYRLADHTGNPILLTNGANNVYVIDPAESHTDLALYVRRSTNGGESWQGPIHIAAQDGFNGLCGAADNRNRLHVAFFHGQQGRSHIYYVHSTDNGVTWGNPNRVSIQTGSGSQGIWADRGDHVFLSFTVFGAQQNYRHSTNVGSTWQNQQILPCLIRNIAADRYNTLHALSVQDNTRILYLCSQARGWTWSDTLQISSLDPGARSKPYIEVDDTPSLHAAWNGRQSGDVQIYYRKCTDPPGVRDDSNLRMRNGKPTFGLHPNPVGATVDLHGNGPVTLFDESGTKVAELQPGPNDVAFLPRGVYFARPEHPAGRPAKMVKLR